MDWWSLFRMITLLHLCVSSSHCQGTSNKEVKSKDISRVNSSTTSFMSAVGIKTKVCETPPPSNSSSSSEQKAWKKPKCLEKLGCDQPLNCFNYTSRAEGNGTFIVLPHDLELILENPAVTNTCAVVMFYAAWCPYSVDFARKFNALGRSFEELPVMAVDFAENDLYKYLTAYIPVVSFYYRGRVIYRFKATESYEELLEQVTIMTGFQPKSVDLDHVENEQPVPIVRVDEDAVYLVTAACWIFFVTLVYVCRTRPVSEWILRIFSRTKKD